MMNCNTTFYLATDAVSTVYQRPLMFETCCVLRHLSRLLVKTWINGGRLTGSAALTIFSAPAFNFLLFRRQCRKIPFLFISVRGLPRDTSIWNNKKCSTI